MFPRIFFNRYFSFRVSSAIYIYVTLRTFQSFHLKILDCKNSRSYNFDCLFRSHEISFSKNNETLKNRLQSVELTEN